MLITNLKKIGASICAITVVASCSVSTTMDDVVEKNIEAASTLREEAKAPTKIANQDLVKVNDDIWLGNTSKSEYEGEPLPSYLAKNVGLASGVTLGLSSSLGGMITPLLGMVADAYGITSVMIILVGIGAMCAIGSFILPEPKAN